MDVRRHGNPMWQQTTPEDDNSDPQPSPIKAKTNAYTQAEAGKTEMSLINFTLGMISHKMSLITIFGHKHFK